MPPHIPAELLPRTRQIILPLVSTGDERDGTPIGFTSLYFRTLMDYGQCEGDDEPAALCEDVLRSNDSSVPPTPAALMISGTG